MTAYADILAVDSDYAKNTILLDFEGVDGGTFFQDWVGNSWTANGNAQTTTTSPIRGSSSLLLDGSGDWITAVVPNVIGTGDFTIECEVVINSFAADGEIFAISDSGAGLSSFNIVFEYKTNGALRISIQNGSGGANLDVTSAAGVLTTGTRYHLAFVADGSTGRGYVEGVQVVSGGITGTRYNQQSYCRIGWLSSSYPRAFNGKIDNLRVKNGICLYPGGTSFTPPTALPTWNRLSYLSSLTTAETNDAQGITSDGTHLWYSSSDVLYKYTKDGTLVTSRSVAGESPADKNQINGLFIKDGRLFATAAKFSTVGTSWVIEYDPTTLAYVQQWDIPGDWFAEGLSWFGGYWWIIFHANKVVAQFDADFNWVATHSLSFSITGSSGGYGAGTGYDGIAWRGEYLLVNIHDVYNENYLDVYTWNGSSFDPVVRWPRTTAKTHQGISIDPVEPGVLWAAERNASGTDGIAKFEILGEFDSGGSGTMAATEVGADSLAASASVLVSGSLIASESGADTLVVDASVTDQPAEIFADMAAVEAQDSFSATGSVLVRGSLAATETGQDIFAAKSGEIIEATMAAVESGDDRFEAYGPIVLHGKPTALRLYLSMPNGKELFHVADVTPGTSSYTITAGRYDSSNILEGQFISGPPPGRIIRHYNGRMLVADAYGNVFYTEPFQPDHFNLKDNFLQFPEAVDIMEPVKGGIFFAYGNRTEFHAGDFEDGFTILPKADYGGIFGTSKKIPNSENVCWQSDRGMCIGTADGQFKNVVEENVATESGDSGASLIREKNGLRQFIAVINNPVTSPLAAQSWIDAETARRS